MNEWTIPVGFCFYKLMQGGGWCMKMIVKMGHNVKEHLVGWKGRDSNQITWIDPGLGPRENKALFVWWPLILLCRPIFFRSPGNRSPSNKKKQHQPKGKRVSWITWLLWRVSLDVWFPYFAWPILKVNAPGKERQAACNHLTIDFYHCSSFFPLLLSFFPSFSDLEEDLFEYPFATSFAAGLLLLCGQQLESHLESAACSICMCTKL